MMPCIMRSLNSALDNYSIQWVLLSMLCRVWKYRVDGKWDGRCRWDRRPAGKSGADAAPSQYKHKCRKERTTRMKRQGNCVTYARVPEVPVYDDRVRVAKVVNWLPRSQMYCCSRSCRSELVPSDAGSLVRRTIPPPEVDHEAGGWSWSYPVGDTVTRGRCQGDRRRVRGRQAERVTRCAGGVLYASTAGCRHIFRDHEAIGEIPRLDGQQPPMLSLRCCSE